MSSWLNDAIQQVSAQHEQAARERQAVLTKPAGALGVLEEVAIRLAGLQASERPRVQQPYISIFAADHGIAEAGVSAFPQAVTAEMVRNFSRGGAAISVLAAQIGARFEVVNCGTVSALESMPHVLDVRIAAGTHNFLEQDAMSQTQFEQALQLGRDAVQRAKTAGSDCWIGGEMGIANTTSATAIACALLDVAPDQLTGPGTGLQPEQIAHKARVIATGLQQRQADADVSHLLRAVGGFEIVALVGAYVSCAQVGLPALVDGFISSVAALAAIKLNPAIRPWLFLSHLSAEPGHRRIADALEFSPLLQLNMRLGEASGAAAAIPLLQLACALHNQMATFAEAAVSVKTAE